MSRAEERAEEDEVFKRRVKRSWLQLLREALWPHGGWARAFHYVKHRIHRLPDDPGRIARGVAAGVFISFTPFFGLHFVSALAMAVVVRGNILAAILGSFFGNPVSFPIIAVFSTKFGNLMLGRGQSGAAGPGADHEGLVDLFFAAAGDLWHNTRAVFTPETARWDGLSAFFDDIFLPYTLGGFVLAIPFALGAYYLSLPVITAYQKRRRARIKERLAEIRARLHSRIEERAERKEARRDERRAGKALPSKPE